MAQKTGQDSKLWHSVSIAPGVKACAEARALRGKRFLSRTKAPKLPLPECTMAATCKCSYKHHTDRREGPRRAGEIGLGRNLPIAENRKRRGRRAPDEY